MLKLQNPNPADCRESDIVIALLEDDGLVTDVLTMTFQSAGWACRHFATVAAISAALGHEPFDLLMLDWSLPDGDADVVIRLAREELGLATPILVESASGDEQRIVRALELGADDYVVKPLRVAEVRARVGALLRRHQTDGGKSPAATFGPFTADLGKREIFLRDEALGLTGMEFELAVYFLRHPEELLPRERLLGAVWGRRGDIDTRTVDAHVSRLRRKLHLGSETGLQISSLRGYGYRLEGLD